MIRVRRSQDRGATKISWLESKHTFSFGEYYNPAEMNFGPLRVINEDRVAPGAGFGTHPHRDMEILTWVLEGELAHQDSTGTAEKIRPGELQRMTAGTGISHSEFNASKTNPVHFLQIWLMPSQRGLPPGYAQKSFASELNGKLRLVASPDARDNSIAIHQNADVYAARLSPGATATFNAPAARLQWVQVARGSISLNGHTLQAGDGAAITAEPSLGIAANDHAEILLFDMAA